MIARALIPLALVLATGAVLAIPAAAKAPQDDWPRINGQVWLNQASRAIEHHGGSRNDKLLGGHRSDRIYGELGSDVIWGDYRGPGNNSWQHDVLVAGPGNDWVYASHGRNNIYGGSGDDTIRVWFGRGSVNCGAGRDILYTSKKAHPNVKRSNCERVSHLSAAQVAERG